MLKKIAKVSFSVLIIGAIIALIILINFNNKNKVSSSDGHITVIVTDINNFRVSQERVEYKEGDTLFDVINAKYNLICEDSAYGHYVTGLSNDNFNITTNGKNSWIWFEIAYINTGITYSDNIDFNDYAEVEVVTGIDGIELVDNMIFGINERDGNHETSMFTSVYINDNEDEKTDMNYILKIITYSVIVIFFISLVILLVVDFKNKNDHITIKELTILAFMSVILFVQEELLTFIPNVQFTFLLMAVYTSVFGLKRSMMIVLVHVILDNLVMGSMMPIVVIPMLIGYIIYVSLIYLVRNKNLFIIVLTASLGSLIYCYSFLVANSLFLDINMYAYFIADIPFEILLILSTILTITCLYNPLCKKISLLYNKDKNDLDEDDR